MSSSGKFNLWVFGIGFALMIIGMFAKTWEIWAIGGGIFLLGVLVYIARRFIGTVGRD